MVRIMGKPGLRLPQPRSAARRPARTPGARERGQATVETVLALLLMCILVLGVIGLIVGAYSVNATMGGVEVASWELDVSQMEASADKDAYVKSVICSRVPGIDPETIEVTGATVARERTTTSASVESKTDFNESKLAYTTEYGQMKCTVTYTVPFTQGLLKLSRDIEHDVRISTDAEVS